MIARGIAYWAKVNELDTKFEPQWKIKLYVDKDEMLKLKEGGQKVNSEIDDEGNVKFFKQFSRKLKNKSGRENTKPIVVDAALNEFKGEIGNGSEVYVKYIPFVWNNVFGKGVGADLDGVQIINLVERVYEENADGSAVIKDDGEGFEIIGESLTETKKKVRKETQADAKEAAVKSLDSEDF